MSDLSIIQQNKIAELRGSLMDALEFTEVQQARIKELEAEIDYRDRLIERQSAQLAKLEAVINTLHAGLENKHTVEALGTRIQRRDNKIAKLERQVKRLQNVVKDWETAFEG